MHRSHFGQRRITVNGDPVDVATSVSRSVAHQSALSDGEPIGALKIVGMLFLAFIFLAWLEALLSGTSLITPINQTLLWTMRGVGLVVGLVVTLLTVLAMADTSLFKRGITLLVCPLLIAFGFGEIAYRISDWTEFGFSSQPFEPAQYPIDSVRHGRKGARSTIQIDPFDTGDRTEIPVSYGQYKDLRDSGDYGCVTVLQRKSASGAIEIQTNGRYMLSEPAEVPVSRCGFAAASTKNEPSGSANPWSKD